MSRRGSNRTVVQSLEPRRLLTSQPFVSFPYANGNFFSPTPGRDGAIYGFSKSAEDYNDGIAFGDGSLRRYDVKSGKTATFAAPRGESVRRLDFFGGDSPFVQFEHGFGLFDAKANKLVRVDDGQLFGDAAVERLHVEGGGRVFFWTEADDGGSYVDPPPQFWVSDGTVAGTRHLDEPTGAFSPEFIGYAGDHAFFVAKEIANDASSTLRLWSVGAKDDVPKLIFDPRRRDAQGVFRNATIFGDRALIQYENEADIETTLLTIDAGGKVGTLKTAGVTTVRLASWSYGVDDRTIGSAAGALIGARTDDRGDELYFVDAKTSKLTRLTDFPGYDVLVKGVERVESPGGAIRWLITTGATPPDSPPYNPFFPVATPALTTSLLDPAKPALVPLSTPSALGGAVWTSEGLFARADDHSVWRLDVDRPVPVAANAFDLTQLGGRLCIQDYLSGDYTYRTLRDTNAIAYGSAFEDDNGNRTRDVGEDVIYTARPVWIDSDHDGRQDKKEPETALSNTGTFYFDGLGAGAYDVRIKEAGWTPSKGSASVDRVTLGKGAKPHNTRFALRPPTATLYVLAFDDKNGNGVLDKKEHPLSFEAFYDDDNDKRPDAIDGVTSLVRATNDYDRRTTYRAALDDVALGRHVLRVRWLHGDGTTSITRLDVALGGGITRLLVPL